MSNEQEQFFDLLSQYPRISVFWNSTERACDVESLKKGMTTMSHGEVILSKFFMSFWFGKNNGFDIFEAASVLGQKERLMIAEWLANPYWP